MDDQADPSEYNQRSELNTTRRDVLAGIGGAAGASAIGISIGTEPVRAATDDYGTRIATCKAGSQVAYTHGPHTEYASSANTTFLVFQGNDDDPYALAYDHDSNTFSEEVKIGANPVPNHDNHGVPTIAVDADGVLHVAYGANTGLSQIQYARSTDPYDITNWENFELNDQPTSTYTSICASGHSIYMFCLGYNGHDRGVLVQSTDGGNTWTSYTVVDNRPGPGGHNDVYAQDVDLYNGRIYFTWVTAYGGRHGAERQMPRMAYFDPNTEHVYTYDGTDLGSTINWDERHQCNVYDHREDDGDDDTNERVVTARHGFNPATDEAYVTFPITREDNRSSVQDFMISIYDGISDGTGTWSTQSIADLSTDVISNYAAPRVNSDNNVEVVLNANGEAGGGSSDPGNNTADGIVATLEDDGSWTTQTVVEDGTYKSGVVRNGTDEFIGFVGENNGNGNYTSRIWAIGTDFVGNMSAPPAPSNLSAGPSSSPPGYSYSSVNLDWNSSPDSDSVDHYNIYVNGTKWTESIDATEKIRGLSSATSYDFYVTAVAGDGCRAAESGRSNVITTATNSGRGKAANYPIAEDTGDSVFDDSGNSQNGDIRGASWATNSSSPGADWNNTVLSYGDGNTVTTPNDHIREASEFTQIAWVKLNSKNGDRSISGDIGRAANSNGGTWTHYIWYDKGTDSLSVYAKDNSGNVTKITDTGVSLPTEEWTMVAWTYEQDGDLTLYKNDIEVSSMETSGNPLNNGVSIRDLGADADSHPSLHGELHSVIEWSKAKSGQFVKNQYYNQT